jgi:hypothetical protein
LDIPRGFAVVFGLVWGNGLMAGNGCRGGYGAKFYAVFSRLPLSATICPYLGAELASSAGPQFLRTRVIDGIAVITAQGERSMNGIPAETAHTGAGAPAEQPTPAQKPRSAAHRAHVAPSQARSGKKATPAKKANKGAKSAQSSKKKATGARQGSKTAKVLDLLKRPGGASLKELRKATGWQPHYADVRIMPTCVGNPVCGAGIAAMESA